MKIYYYKHEFGNVGDDLNPWLWPKLMPSLFTGERYHGGVFVDESDIESIFIGIGTILNSQLPIKSKKAVLGAGTGYGKSISHDNAKYYAVRGPLTAERLGLNPKVAVTDGAALIATLDIPKVDKKHKISLMPHHESTETGRWEIVAKVLGFNFINACNSPDYVIQEILKSELVVTEAMHGAILSDTLRVPWIPFLTTEGKHEFKWRDWCLSLNMEYRPIKLYGLWSKSGLLPEIKNFVKMNANVLKLKRNLLHVDPYLSQDSLFYSKLQIMSERLEDFKNDLKSGYFN
jgi:succinoglycan biosynthesis protein ExoV